MFFAAINEIDAQNLKKLTLQMSPLAYSLLEFVWRAISNIGSQFENIKDGKDISCSNYSWELQKKGTIWQKNISYEIREVGWIFLIIQRINARHDQFDYEKSAT